MIRPVEVGERGDGLPFGLSRVLPHQLMLPSRGLSRLSFRRRDRRLRARGGCIRAAFTAVACQICTRWRPSIVKSRLARTCLWGGKG